MRESERERGKSHIYSFAYLWHGRDSHDMWDVHRSSVHMRGIRMCVRMSVRMGVRIGRSYSMRHTLQ